MGNDAVTSRALAETLHRGGPESSHACAPRAEMDINKLRAVLRSMLIRAGFRARKGHIVDGVHRLGVARRACHALAELAVADECAQWLAMRLKPHGTTKTTSCTK